MTEQKRTEEGLTVDRKSIQPVLREKQNSMNSKETYKNKEMNPKKKSFDTSEFKTVCMKDDQKQILELKPPKRDLTSYSSKISSIKNASSEKFDDYSNEIMKKYIPNEVNQLRSSIKERIDRGLTSERYPFCNQTFSELNSLDKKKNETNQLVSLEANDCQRKTKQDRLKKICSMAIELQSQLQKTKVKLIEISTENENVENDRTKKLEEGLTVDRKSIQPVLREKHFNMNTKENYKNKEINPKKKSFDTSEFKAICMDDDQKQTLELKSLKADFHSASKTERKKSDHLDLLSTRSSNDDSEKANKQDRLKKICSMAIELQSQLQKTKVRLIEISTDNDHVENDRTKKREECLVMDRKCIQPVLKEKYINMNPNENLKNKELSQKKKSLGTSEFNTICMKDDQKQLMDLKLTKADFNSTINSYNKISIKKDFEKFDDCSNEMLKKYLPNDVNQLRSSIKERIDRGLTTERYPFSNCFAASDEKYRKKYSNEISKKLTYEEKIKFQNEVKLLKLKEKALIERTNAELSWLRQMKKRLKNRVGDEGAQCFLKKSIEPSFYKDEELKDRYLKETYKSNDSNKVALNKIKYNFYSNKYDEKKTDWKDAVLNNSEFQERLVLLSPKIVKRVKSCPDSINQTGKKLSSSRKIAEDSMMLRDKIEEEFKGKGNYHEKSYNLQYRKKSDVSKSIQNEENENFETNRHTIESNFHENSVKKRTDKIDLTAVVSKLETRSIKSSLRSNSSLNSNEAIGVTNHNSHKECIKENYIPNNRLNLISESNSHMCLRNEELLNPSMTHESNSKSKNIFEKCNENTISEEIENKEILENHFETNCTETKSAFECGYIKMLLEKKTLEILSEMIIGKLLNYCTDYLMQNDSVSKEALFLNKMMSIINSSAKEKYLELSFLHMIVDLIEELFCEFLIHQKRMALNKSKSISYRTNRYIKENILEIFDTEKNHRITKWRFLQQKDVVDSLLNTEMRKEESSWCDFEKEQTEIKISITEMIYHHLINDALFCLLKDKRSQQKNSYEIFCKI